MMINKDNWTLLISFTFTLVLIQSRKLDDGDSVSSPAHRGHGHEVGALSIPVQSFEIK